MIVLLVLENQSGVLLQKRTNTSFGSNLYALPGGKVEAGEAARAAAIREAVEELGIHVEPNNLELIHVVHRKGTETTFPILCFRMKIWKGSIINNEAEKCAELIWRSRVEIESAHDIIPAHKQALIALWQRISYSEHGW